MDGYDLKNRFKESLLDMDEDEALELTEKITDEYGVEEFLDNILMMVLRDIGDMWENDTISLAQVYVAGKICEVIVDKLIQKNTNNTKQNQIKKIAIVNLEDYHSLGKIIVSSALKCSKFQLIDYGHGINVASLVEKVIRDKVDILLISILMYPSALKVKEVRKGFLDNKYKVKILVGGAPFLFDNLLWKQVNADAMGKSAAAAVDILEKWTGEENFDE